MILVNPVVYDQANLQVWQTELPRIQSQIAEKNRSINKQRNLLHPYQSRLDFINSRISEIEHQLIVVDINMGSYRAHHMHHHSHPHEYRYEINDIPRERNRIFLQTQLKDFQSQHSLLQKEMKPYAKALDVAEKELSHLRERETFLNTHIPTAQLFLRTLKDNPFAVVDDLAKKLQKKFTDYEDTHLLDLSPQERISLLAVRFGLKQFIDKGKERNPQKYRTNYLRLCAFIWDMYSKVRKENKGGPFEILLAELIESTHVLQHGDLPDDLKTGKSAQTWFKESKRAKPEYFSIQTEELSYIEERLLSRALFLYTQSDVSQATTNLQKHIINVANLIEAEVKMKKQKKKPIDYHFYGRAARILNEVSRNPKDIHAAKRLGDIAECASGHPSVGKQVLGGILLVLGVLLIGASIVAFTTTMGLSSMGMFWGMNVLKLGIILGVASSTITTTGIGLAFFAGPLTIKSGLRQGLSKELGSIKKEVEKSHDAILSYKKEREHDNRFSFCNAMAF